MDKPVVMSIGVSRTALLVATLGTLQIFTRDSKARTALLEYHSVNNIRIFGDVAVVTRMKPRKTRQLQWQGTGEACLEFLDISAAKPVATIVGLVLSDMLVCFVCLALCVHFFVCVMYLMFTTHCSTRARDGLLMGSTKPQVVGEREQRAVGAHSQRKWPTSSGEGGEEGRSGASAEITYQLC